MTQLEAVPVERVPLYWPHVSRYIAQAVSDCGHCWSLNDVRNDLNNLVMQLWVIWKDGEICGVICTHIFHSPRGKTCAMPVVGCDDMAGCIGGTLDTITDFAKANGCVRLQGEGRKGWERALKPLGWKPITTQVEKVL